VQYFQAPGQISESLIESTFTTSQTTTFHSYVTLANPNGDRACFAADFPGVYTFELRVTDHCPLVAPYTAFDTPITVTASCPTLPPVTAVSDNTVQLVRGQFNRYDLNNFIILNWNTSLVQFQWSAQLIPVTSNNLIISQANSRDAYFVPDVAGLYLFNVQITTTPGCSNVNLTITVNVECPGTDATASTQFVDSSDVIRWSQTRSSADGVSTFDAVAPADAGTTSTSSIPSSSPAKLNGGGIKIGSGSVNQVSSDGGSDDNGSSGLSRGAIIAIAVSLGVVGAMVLVLGIVYCLKATSANKVTSTQ